MATYPARLQSISDALVNGVATAGQVTAFADGIIGTLTDEEITALVPAKTRATLTNAEKAGVVVETLKRRARLMMREGARLDSVRNSAAAADAAAEAAFNAIS